MQVYCEQDTLLPKFCMSTSRRKSWTQGVSTRARICRYHDDAGGFRIPFNEEHVRVGQYAQGEAVEIHDQSRSFSANCRRACLRKDGQETQGRVVLFNPGSRQQTAQRLRERYPEISFSQTEKGNVKVDDEVLEKLGEKYPEAKLLAEYQTLNKRLGQIAEGKEAWLKHSRVFDDSRIHGTVITNACISGRCSHRRPNTAQIPSVGHPYGAECRALFVAPVGWLLCGSDASGLELRALGAWLAHFDEGEYAKLVSTDGFESTPTMQSCSAYSMGKVIFQKRQEI